MNILITSGGTSEKIDQVRSITNHSTGQLGKMIAERFLDAGFPVTLVTSPTAVRPKKHPLLTTFLTANVAELQLVLKEQTTKHQVLIHAMAVSDYSPVYMTGFEAIKGASNLEQFLHCANQESKISSDDDYQVLFLKKNPKLIYINTAETVISLEDSILTAFLNLIGFDIIFFVPTGYQSIERYFNGNIIEEHQIGEYKYDMQVPNLNVSSSGRRMTWREKLFGR